MYIELIDEGIKNLIAVSQILEKEKQERNAVDASADLPVEEDSADE